MSTAAVGAAVSTAAVSTAVGYCTVPPCVITVVPSRVRHFVRTVRLVHTRHVLLRALVCGSLVVLTGY